VELSSAEINTLSRFFRDDRRLTLAVKGKLKSWLDENFDLYHNCKAFMFTEQNKAKLRADIEKDNPSVNMRQGIPQGLNRIEVTHYVNDDKLADVRPNDKYVLATTQCGKMTTAGQTRSIPAGVSLRLPISSIDFTLLESVIIIENQDVFDAWHRANLPIKYQSSLAIYRGNDRIITTGVKTLLDTLSSETEVLMFPDLDPKGLENCFTTAKVSGILAPSLIDIKTLLFKRTQAKKFVLQQNALTYLGKQTFGNWHLLITYVLDNQLAIMQQSMIALGLPTHDNFIPSAAYLC
jgi:hypothetical protein